jgi:hypothetical protein
MEKYYGVHGNRLKKGIMKKRLLVILFTLIKEKKVRLLM